ncbi:MAG: phosphoribulokinase [Solirubrobacteraceae bacterium]
MPRPILLGIAGDSAAGKTTLTRGLVRVLGESRVTHVCADHYHRHSRTQRAERGLTPLHPEANHLDILEQHLGHLRAGRAILKPVYRHQDGSLAPPEHVEPMQFTIVEGMLCFHTAVMRDTYDVRIYLDTPEDLRRGWKVQRDCSRRGYTTDEVLTQLDQREADAQAFVRPQRRHADIVITFTPGDRGDPEHLDARLTMRPGLAHPELPPLTPNGDGVREARCGAETVLWVPGTIAPELSAAFEEAVWDRLHFASHLRTERLGEFTVGTELRRSEPLAIIQLLVLYQLVTARAAVALGATGVRVDRDEGSERGEAAVSAAP